MTGISAASRAAITSRRTRPPSILTATAPPSLTRRSASRAASRGDTWKLPYGMSTMTGISGRARATARQWWSMSSTVTGRVVSCPSTTMPRESPTSSASTPASRLTRAETRS